MRLYMPFSFSAGKSGRYCRPLRKPLKWQCHLSGAGDIRSCTRGALFLLWEQTFFYSQATKSHQVKPLPTDATPLSAASLLRPGALREESQSLRAVLREVSQCDENTKPSLRIFHLQQLASLRNTDVLLLQQQPQVKDLLERLTLDAGHLSPPQLHALLLSAAKLQIPSNHRVWRVALHQLLRHTQNKGVTVAEACSAARCCATGPADVDKKKLVLILKRALQDAGRINEFDAACILFTIRRYHFNPRRELEKHIIFSEGGKKSEVAGADAVSWPATASDGFRTPLSGSVTVNKNIANNNDITKAGASELSLFALKCVRACAWALERQFASLSPKSIVCCLYEFARLQLMPWRLLLQMQRRLRIPNELQQLCGRGLAQLALTLSVFQHRDSRLLRRIARVVALREETAENALSNRSLCLLLHAFSALGFRDQHLLNVATHRIESRAVYFDNIKIAMAANALGRLGVRHHEAWSCINKLAAERAHQQSPLHIFLLLQSAAKANAAEPEAVHSLLEAARKLKRGFTAPQLLNILDAVALSGYLVAHTAVYLELLDMYIYLGETGMQNQLSRIAFSLLLECPEAIASAPRSIQHFVERHQLPFQEIEKQKYHQQIREKLHEFGIIAAEGPIAVGPYMVDAAFPKKVLAALPDDEASGSTLGKTEANDRKAHSDITLHAAPLETLHNVVCVDFPSESCFCPLTGDILGSLAAKRRHLQTIGCIYIFVRRRVYEKLSPDKQTQMLHSLLLQAKKRLSHGCEATSHL